ncbi:lipoprotein [Betaproteobacteria bacterium]|nr:lipoprotein [Betaproteobacteria bacterium]GHT93690.1 lipoprotein [Betaproteobacteria bacterium]GHT98278.1 lipoprotein [Betaproteobacteria bacterium]GHT99453.1 lipoprotein [Betaproteobacteria bacterium]GHU24065.1 lipoprotein [Betaproteobacteria bacterium]
MNRPSLSFVSPLVAALALAGCTSSTDLFESKKIDYKSTRPAQTLEIPPDLTTPTRDDRYAVPDVNPRGTATFSAYSADRAAAQPGLGVSDVLPQPEKMRIERAGSQRWLVVPGTPDEVWPQLRDFWLELGFILNIDDPGIGVLETDWAENRAKLPQDILRATLGKFIDNVYSTPERDKFRTRIEEGKDAGTVEIYVSHRGMMEIYPNEARDTTVWQPRAPEPELEAEMLRRLMIRFGADEARAAAALTTAPRIDELAKILEVSGQQRLQVSEPFDRAWRRVGLALDRVGFTVEDRDRAKGIYFVRYIDPEADNNPPKNKGFFSRLLFWRSDDVKAKSGDEFRIQVSGRGDASLIAVQNREGVDERTTTVQRILNLLQKELR